MADMQLVSASFIVLYNLLKKSKKKKRRSWTSPLFVMRSREPDVNSSFLLQDLLSEEYQCRFKNFTKMSMEDFNFILNHIREIISKSDTKFRKAIPCDERLAVTLRFLATGDSYVSLQYLFKISKQAISRIIPEVFEAIIHCLGDFVQVPSSTEEWKEISKRFEEVWNFPHCVGSIDGKHVLLQAPMKSGSDFFNYKS
ncbi:unnamed protein product [Acanthoscelides obtectus]|uniref:Protein ANTAGONIST OF LIKE HETEROCHROMATIN PROTEIN 1-like n=1 Tax=Acanthoscelides obtectus TaxID=200917 RepID=A0A9P0PE69_ACAOB|nr:unnamed protein product [Acanthoscelides obtectus]CAK1641889.1 Protein ANTAGONIST OF LIKE HETEROCHROMATIN PROTEIN 1 [Acanthoscelides obtectus]